MRSVLRNPFPGERPRKEDAHLDSMMASDSPSPVVEPLLRALAADPRPHELGGFDEPLATYRATFPRSRPSPHKTWRPAMPSSMLGAKLGATIAGVAAGLSGVAVAAYTGSLTTGAQSTAHTTISAPAARLAATPRPTATGTPVGPDVTGPAAFGLCNAWTHHQAQGGKAGDSVAFKNLATAAGGENKIAAFCAKVPHPGNAAHPTGKPTNHPTGKPTNHPTGKWTTHPSGKWTTHPSGKWTTHPSSKRTTQPSGQPTTVPRPSAPTP